jgi:hypothetical protein
MTDNDKTLVERPCTCHADDAPSVCQKKYALNECLIEAQAAEIERLREALRQIAAPAYVSVGTHKHMHLAWREIACRRIDIARDVLGETE